MTSQITKDAAAKGVAQDLSLFVTAEILPLLGDRAAVLHSPWARSGDDLSGSDVDTAVYHLDPLWPLRLPKGWRLCQALHYDTHGWTWVLEHDGRLLHVDTLDDPRGLGRYGFPTRLLAEEESTPGAGVYAAYLAVKRIRKGDRRDREWSRIARLATQDPSSLQAALTASLGRRLAQSVYQACLDGSTRDLTAWGRLRWQQRLRRVRTPWRLTALLVLGARRVRSRASRPTGLFVLVAGPDGSGKSTLATSLPSLCDGLFRRYRHWHWCPGFLPRPGALIGQEQSDSNDPHGRPPRSRVVSRLLLAYYWCDHLLGGLLWVLPLRARAGLLVNERGWWDLLVDPQRYRLQGIAGAARLLGRLLPHPDLGLALEAPPEMLIQRKPEVELGELSRQNGAFPASLPSRVRTVRIDASKPSETVKEHAREEILQSLERRAIAGLGAGWSSLPGSRGARLLVPRGPRLAAREAMRIHPPRSLPQVAAWHAGWLLGSMGAFRLLPRGLAPPEPVRRALTGRLPARSSLAVMGVNEEDTYLALVVDESGQCNSLAWVAASAVAADMLDREARAIERLGRLLGPPLSAPVVLDHQPGLLLLQAIPWRPRVRTTFLPSEVATGLGRFYRAGNGHTTGPANGTCTPWTLLRTQDGWVLLDWKQASGEMPPFYDLVFYLLQARARRGRPPVVPDLAGAVDDGRSPVGRAIISYAVAASIPSCDVPEFLAACVERVLSDMNLTRGDQ
jgi:hypothetical protein